MADDEEPEGDDGPWESDAHVPWPHDGEIHYINTDIDLSAEGDVGLDPLIDALEARGLYALTPAEYRKGDHGWLVVFETEDTFNDPDLNIARLLDAIESLDPAAADLWRACTPRELNIGYNCGDRPWSFNQALRPATLARMAAAGLTLRLTIYPERPPKDAPAPPPAQIEDLR